MEKGLPGWIPLVVDRPWGHVQLFLYAEHAVRTHTLGEVTSNKPTPFHHVPGCMAYTLVGGLLHSLIQFHALYVAVLLLLLRRGYLSQDRALAHTVAWRQAKREVHLVRPDGRVPYPYPRRRH